MLCEELRGTRQEFEQLKFHNITRNNKHLAIVLLSYGVEMKRRVSLKHFIFWLLYGLRGY